MREGSQVISAPIVVALIALLVPGLLVGASLGLRREVLLGWSPVLSCGVLATAAMVSSRGPLAWGLPLVVVVTAAIGAIAWGVRPFRSEPRRTPVGSGDAAVRAGDGFVSIDPLPPRQGRWLVGLVLLSCLVLGVTVGRGMGGLRHMQQGYDTAYHVNAIQHVAMTGDATAASVGSHQIWYAPVNPNAFYPPLFADLGALVLRAGAEDAVVAANIVALALSVVAWPLGMMLLIRVLVPQSPMVQGMAILTAAVAIPMPYVALSFGVLWPLLTGFVLIPPLLAALWLLLAPPRGALDRGRLVVATFVLVVGTLGLILGHPSALVMLGVLALPMLLWWGWWLARTIGRAHGRAAEGFLWAGVVVGGLVVVAACRRVGVLRRVAAQDWPATRTPAQALKDVLTLSPAQGGVPMTRVLWGVVVLTVIGAGWMLMTRARERWVVASHAIVAGLYILAAAVDSPLSQALTGLWYNDAHRVGAALGMTAPILAGWGVVALSRMASALGLLARPVTALAVVGLTLAVPVPAASRWATDTVRESYVGAPGRVMTTEAEEEVYRHIPRGDETESVIGSPFTGTAVAGPLSHHRSVFGHLMSPVDEPRRILKTRFRDYQRDPEVCRIVQRLHIRYAVEDLDYYEPGREADRRDYWRGLVDLDRAPGLRRIGGNARTAIYEVTPCLARQSTASDR